VQLIGNAVTSVTIYALAPVPLFLIMGEVLFHSGMAIRVFDALDKLMGRLPGRLCYLTIGGGTIFAALSGSSMANTAMLGSLMVPEMVRRGYHPSMAMGPIMGTGALAMIIPPSGLAVLLGSLARIDIGALLIAGIIPGLILACMYVAIVAFRVKLDPSCAPNYDVAPSSGREKLRSLAVDVSPMGLIVFCVVGLMILGWATPTGSAAFGALSVIALAAIYRSLKWETIVKSLRGTISVTGMLLLIIFASSTFSQLLAFSGASSGLIGWATGFHLPPLVMLMVMFAIMLALGCFMDQVSMMMLTLPIFMPIAAQYGFDPIWFGVILLLSLEIGLLTPPFGLVLFVMLGVAPQGTTIQQVVNAALPFIACPILLVLLIVLLPDIATLLPSMMK
ncbi:MAG: TRAP transporter large permease, partial [Deltaproteobacteria bacterium]|nr:TRAP transporter large permease [Deltaproteobacteria bacterium]